MSSYPLGGTRNGLYPRGPSIYRDYAAIPASTVTVIRSSCAPLLEPAPGYFLRLMPFSENSLVTCHLDDVISRNGRNVASHTPAVREIRRLRIGNLQTNEDLLSMLHTNADDCGRPAIGRMRIDSTTSETLAQHPRSDLLCLAEIPTAESVFRPKPETDPKPHPAPTPIPSDDWVRRWPKA